MKYLCLRKLILLNLKPEILKNALKTHDTFMFDKIIPSNSTLVGENLENLVPDISQNAMKSHEKFMFEKTIPSTFKD